MGTHVVVQRMPGQRTCYLEVSYDGLEPPAGLYADLSMIGWKTPAFEPPPASAIDWSTPDPSTAEMFTVLPWRVQRQVVEPPAGSGPRRSWKDSEEAAFMMALDGVLSRHGVGDRAPTAGLPAPPQAPLQAVEPPAQAPAEAPRLTGTVVLRAEGASPGAATRVAALLDGLGVEYTLRSATRAVPITFRGAVTEIEKEVLAVALRTNAAKVADVAAALRNEGLDIVAQVQSSEGDGAAASSAA